MSGPKEFDPTTAHPRLYEQAKAAAQAVMPDVSDEVVAAVYRVAYRDGMRSQGKMRAQVKP